MLDLKNKRIILASASPRRKQLLALMDVPFLIAKNDGVEKMRTDMTPQEAVVDLAVRKSEPLMKNFDDNDIVITADTIVVVNDVVLGKPQNREEEKTMLKMLSGTSHDVITGVAITTKNASMTFYDVSKVFFRELTDVEIDYYTIRYNPIDKAGAYGVQDWIGAVAITKIEGSYYNVMGLPTEKLYVNLEDFLKKYE